eukprot:6270748-Amphidinium_carterae.1
MGSANRANSACAAVLARSVTAMVSGASFMVPTTQMDAKREPCTVTMGSRTTYALPLQQHLESWQAPLAKKTRHCAKTLSALKLSLPRAIREECQPRSGVGLPYLNLELTHHEELATGGLIVMVGDKYLLH